MGALLGGYALPVVFIRGDLCPMREEGCTGDVTFTKVLLQSSLCRLRHKDEGESRGGEDVEPF